MNLARSTYYYQPHRRAKDEHALKQRIEAICNEFPRYGYRHASRRNCSTRVGASITSAWHGSCVSPV